MAIYSLSLAATTATATTPNWDCRGASGSNPKVMEYMASNGAATVTNWGWGRSGNTPTQSGPVTVIAEGLEGTGLTTCCVAWSVAATVPTQFFRRWYGPATIGAGIFFTFPRGLILAAAGATFVQWTFATSTALSYQHVVVDE